MTAAVKKKQKTTEIATDTNPETVTTKRIRTSKTMTIRTKEQ